MKLEFASTSKCVYMRNSEQGANQKRDTYFALQNVSKENFNNFLSLEGGKKGNLKMRIKLHTDNKTKFRLKCFSWRKLIKLKSNEVLLSLKDRIKINFCCFQKWEKQIKYMYSYHFKFFLAIGLKRLRSLETIVSCQWYQF